MTADRIRVQLIARPFRPFDVCTAFGQTCQVPHSDIAWISPIGRDLVVAADNDAVDVLSLLHVADMQTADSKEASA